MKQKTYYFLTYVGLTYIITIYKHRFVTNIIPMLKPPSKRLAQDMIRQCVAESRVKFHPHALARGKKRKVTTLQMLNCLSKGNVDEEPTQNYSHKGWQTAVVAQVSGVHLRVVVCLRWAQDVLIITTYDQ